MLDTNVLLLGLVPPDDFTDFKVSSVTWAELRRGAGISRGAGDRAKALAFEGQYNSLRAVFGAGLSFDDACAAAFQSLVELTHAAGRESRSRTLDLMIAATAAAHDAAVVTHNPDDFRGLESVVRVVGV